MITLIKRIAFLLIFTSSLQSIRAQALNWNTLDSTKHIININTGLDYSLSLGLAYAYMLNTKLPSVLKANISTPIGEKLFDDFKTKIGAQVCAINTSNFKGTISIFGVYRKYQANLVRLQNFGSDMKGTFGYYKPKWFVAAELGFDKAIVTHFKHSQTFKDEIYADVLDGWYQPSTGGNFYYGLQTAYTFKRSDISLSIGKVISQDFKTTPFLPFYLELGYNYRIH